MKKILIFTDLDGTLLDFNTYSFEPALPTLELIKEKDIPLVICSSKTKKEIEYYREKTDNHHPFISENGGGIFIPKGYFDLEGQYQKFNAVIEKDYVVIKLGAGYSDLRKAVKELQQEGFDIIGFGDLTAKEIARLSGMSIDEARMAKERYFDEPFIHKGAGYRLPNLLKAINEKGFKFTQGKFFHILGSSNKGIAVSILIDLYKIKYKETKTVAIGDSPNDIPMLERVNCPVIVKKNDGSYDSQIKVPKLILADGIGPAGWNKAVMRILAE